MIKFNYKDVAKEQGWSFDKINPIVEHPSGYNYYKAVVEKVGYDTVMLDIGCGSGEKSIRYFSLAKKIIMLDLEPEMLKKARENVSKYYTKGAEKFEFVQGDADGVLPYPDESFDLVVSRHCGANMSEVYRVLKKGGIFVSEDIDYKDCLELKECFGRGQDWDEIKANNPHKKETFNACLNAGFSDINLKNFAEIEYYPDKDQLKYLLTRTPILGYYDEETDDKTLDKYISANTTDKGIRLVRRLYAFYLVK